MTIDISTGLAAERCGLCLVMGARNGMYLAAETGHWLCSDPGPCVQRFVRSGGIGHLRRAWRPKHRRSQP